MHLIAAIVNFIGSLGFLLRANGDMEGLLWQSPLEVVLTLIAALDNTWIRAYFTARYYRRVET